MDKSFASFKYEVGTFKGDLGDLRRRYKSVEGQMTDLRSDMVSSRFRSWTDNQNDLDERLLITHDDPIDDSSLMFDVEDVKSGLEKVWEALVSVSWFYAEPL